ncbi:glycosyltransferase [Porticoccus sp. W117]|uniref:glycosyltransferase n=1 Tax=Porticoccus sp. W117 TaxID=3054777 RepID=UPI0025955A55|nr:glycosyltransferase [Porticoccus sp. W117]MDM3869889.1 glycosyltransferase [Porticoccus sp. W117]
MTTILIIGYVWPEPNSSAAGARITQLIECFQEQGWNVHFASAAAPTEHMVDLDAMGVAIQNILINDASFDQYVHDLQPDIVVFDRFVSEEQYGWRVEKQCSDALRVLDSEDLHCLRDARHKAHRQNRAMEDADLNSEMALREVAAIFRSDLSLMISDYEIQLLTERFSVPVTLLHHCPFMLDVEGLDNSDLPTFEQRQHFVSIGNFRHAPNWDAVLFLKQTIWPLIQKELARKQLPNAELHIYGAYPPPKATALHNERDGFLVKGWAEDAFHVVRNARINLAPLRFGAGIKGKLADGMLCGTPSITTGIGTESMTAGLPWGGEIANDPERFAEAAVRLYQDQSSWLSAQQNGLAIARQLFDKQRLHSELTDILEQAMTEREQRRQGNFIGAMLRHHHHRSTQFMGQWIEAKNRLAERQNPN